MKEKVIGQVPKYGVYKFWTQPMGEFHKYATRLIKETATEFKVPGKA